MGAIRLTENQPMLLPFVGCDGPLVLLLGLVHRGASTRVLGSAMVRRPARDFGSTRTSPRPFCLCRACRTVKVAPARLTASHGRPSASPWRSPSARATDHRAALRVPYAAVRIARASLR
jgi:hypothetical protein